MLKKTITYTDFDGNERSEDHYFNLTKTELVKMRFMENGGLENLIDRIISEQDNAKLMELFNEVVLRSYGRKSLDGKRFEKSPEISKEFMETGAYDELFMELLDSKKCAEFINGIIPKELMDEINTKETANIRPIN